MNTYTENLRSTLVALLRDQELSLKALDSQYRAAKFSRYYAHGAAVSAKAAVEANEKDRQLKLSVKAGSQLITDTAVCLAGSAQTAGQLVSASVSQMAACASNVQIATNAIVKLASDISGIRAMVEAADHGSDISQLTEDLYKLMNETAVEAQRASLIAMEASMLTAEVPAAIVAEQAKQAGQSAAQLLAAAGADVDNVSTALASEYAVFVTATSAEKKAETAAQQFEEEYNAALKANRAVNKALNLGLSAIVSGSGTLVVEFDAVRHPFKQLAVVSEYVLVIVKDSKKWTFSLEEAEEIASSGNQRQYVKIIPGAEMRLRQVIETDRMQDADGEVLKQGANYVLFVLAFYKEDYQRTINSYDNLLSAPSSVFGLNTCVAQVNAATLQVSPQSHAICRLSFKVDKELKRADYRCILLPQPSFFFDIEIAEQVSAANYFLAAEKPANSKQYHAQIGPDTTDCFGNQLIDGWHYKPVVLATADVKAGEAPGYTPALSDTTQTDSFIYQVTQPSL